MLAGLLSLGLWLMSQPSRATCLALGALMLLASSAHNARAIADGRFADCFWICNVSAVVLGIGWMLRSPRCCAAGGIWLLAGTLVWLADVWLANSNIITTSYAVHLGGSALALAAARWLGSPASGWRWALGLLAATLLISRFGLPATANINAAHHIPPGWHVLGTSRFSFVISATTLSVITARFVGFCLSALSPSGERGATSSRG